MFWNRVAVAVVGLMVLFAAPQARAQEGIYSTDHSWAALKAGPCFIILFTPDQLAISWEGIDIRLSWGGECTDDGLANGNGVLTTEFTVSANEWNPDATHFRMENSVSAANGLLQGSGSEATYSDADDWDDSTPPGSMQWHDFGDVRNPMPSWYQNSCSYFVDGDGSVDTSRANQDCDPAAGAAFQRAILTNDTTQFAGMDTPTAPAAEENDAEPVPEANGSNNRRSGGSGSGTCALTPDETLARFDSDFGALTASKPMPADAGARDTYQYTYYLGVEGLKLMEPYRSCLGPHEAPNDAQMREMIDSGLKGCEALSSASGTCVPKYPF